MVKIGYKPSAPEQRLLKALVMLVLIITSATHVSAQMGGAFPQFSWGGGFKASFLEGVPLNDSFALLYNPAAVRAVSSRQISIEQIAPSQVPVTGITWHSGGVFGGHLVVRQTPPGLGFDYSTYQLGVTYGAGFGNLTLGVTPKILLVSISGTETGRDDTALGCALDVGVGYDQPIQLHSLWRLTLDCSTIDLISRLRYGSGTVERAVRPAYRRALSIGNDRFTLGISTRCTSARTTVQAGLEYVLFGGKDLYADVLENVVLRAGIARKQFGFGIGLKLKGFGVDYAYRFGSENWQTELAHAVSASWHF